MAEEPKAGASQDRFVWPPRPARPADATGSDLAPQSPGDPPIPLAAAGRWVHAIEREWVGVRGWPWSVRAAEAGWEGDARGAYCPRCGETAAELASDADGCAVCRGKRLPWARAIRLGSYEGVLREAVQEFKFGPWRRLGQDLGRDLGARVKQELELLGIDPTRVLVVPVPTTAGRRITQGVDHALVLAREVARTSGGRIGRVVWRKRGPAQKGASATERARNVAGAFRPRRGWVRGWGVPDLRGWTVVVVDDVRTTGATLRGVCRAIKAGQRDLFGGALRREKRKDSIRFWVAVVGVTPVRRDGAS